MRVSLYLHQAPLEVVENIKQLAATDGATVETDTMTSDGQQLLVFCMPTPDDRLKITIWSHYFAIDDRITRVEYERENHPANQPHYKVARRSTLGVAVSSDPAALRTLYYSHARNETWLRDGTQRVWTRTEPTTAKHPWVTLESCPLFIVEAWEHRARATNRPSQAVDAGAGEGNRPDRHT
jgi:hypothetical protein